MKHHGQHGASGERLNRAPSRHADPATGTTDLERTRGRRLLLVVGVFFLGPFVAAWLLHASGWRPAAQVNRGALVTPAVALPPLDAPRLDAGARALRDGAWTVIIVTRGACADACRQAVADTRRAFDLLGADRDRVQRALIAAQRFDAGALADQADLVAFDASAAEHAALLAPFADAVDGAVFIADPQRNLVLRYAPGEEPKHLLDDLKRLLKYSGS